MGLNIESKMRNKRMKINTMKKNLRELDSLLQQKSKEFEIFLVAFEEKYAEMKKLRKEFSVLKLSIAKDKRNKCRAYLITQSSWGRTKHICRLKRSNNSDTRSSVGLCSRCEYTQGEIATRLLVLKLRCKSRKRIH